MGFIMQNVLNGLSCCHTKISVKFQIPTLSEAIGSLDWRCNCSSGSMLNRQQTEAQLLTGSKTADSGDFSIHWTGCHLSQLHLDSWPGQHPVHWTENKLGQLHLNNLVFPELNQLTYFNIGNQSWLAWWYSVEWAVFIVNQWTFL